MNLETTQPIKPEDWMTLRGTHAVTASKPQSKDVEKLARKLADAIDKLNAKESDLVRAQNAWVKARRTVKYLEKELDKHSEIAKS